LKIEEKTMENKVTFYEETNFKNTELGEIPADWEVVKLCGLIVDEMNGDWGKGVKENPDFTECFVLRGTDFQKVANGDFEEVPIRFLKGSSLIKRRLQDGDVLVELSGGGEKQPTGRVLLARRNWLEKVHLPVVFSNFVKRIRISDSVCYPEYFYLYWKLLYQNKKTSLYERRTTGIRNFKYKDFVQNESIPLPPLEEQKAIAYVLSTVQEAREKTEKVTEATKELKKSLMKHLFTYGPVSLEEASRISLKETEIGEIPADWEVVKLGEVALRMKAGGTPHTAVKEFWNGDIPFVLIEDMTGQGVFLSKTKRMITQEGLRNSSAWLVPANSLLVSMYATIGETAINLIPVATNQAIIAIVPRENFDVLYGAYFIKYDSRRLQMQNIQSTQKNVNRAIVENFSIPLPPLSVQKRIAEILQTVDEKIQAEEKKKQALGNLFNSMLHMLMSGKLRVKFQTSEEGASN